MLTITDLSFPKRLLLNLLFSLLWGLSFTFMFSKLSGYNYIFDFWQDSALAAGSMALLFGSGIEIIGVFVRKKVKIIRTEIEQDGDILIDGAVGYLAEKPKISEGWLFLTEKTLIFRTISKKKSKVLNIPITSIQKISKHKSVFHIYINDILYFQVNKKLADLLNSKLTNLSSN